MLTKTQVLDTLRELAAELRSPVWLVGGVAADFHVGRWTRGHDDIDLVTFEEFREPLIDELARLGFVAGDDRGWIRRWARGEVDISVAFEERVDETTGQLVIRREYAPQGLVPGVYLEVAGNLDVSRFARIDDVSFRVASAESDWVFSKGYGSFRPGSPMRPTVEHNLQLLESVLGGDAPDRLRPLVGRRRPLPDESRPRC